MFCSEIMKRARRIMLDDIRRVMNAKKERIEKDDWENEENTFSLFFTSEVQDDDYKESITIWEIEVIRQICRILKFEAEFPIMIIWICIRSKVIESGQLIDTKEMEEEVATYIRVCAIIMLKFSTQERPPLTEELSKMGVWCEEKKLSEYESRILTWLGMRLPFQNMEEANEGSCEYLIRYMERMVGWDREKVKRIVSPYFDGKPPFAFPGFSEKALLFFSSEN
jgi:hypothetical protein